MKRKRSYEDDEGITSLVKRTRHGFRLNLLELSDEILLRVLSYLNIRELTVVERVSLRLQQLATDHEVWKSKYYDTWIEPRLRRVPLTSPSIKRESQQLSKSVRWFECGNLLRADGNVDWKRQYKIRRNWANGSAKVHEIEIAIPPSPPVLARVHNGVVFTADSKAGLRAWSHVYGLDKLLAQYALCCESRPTSIAVETRDDMTDIIIGFQEGDFAIYTFRDGTSFTLLYKHLMVTKSSLDCVAISWPYVATVSTSRNISLYELTYGTNQTSNSLEAKSIANLHSEASYAHASLALRRVPGTVIATVAYAFGRLNAGWCLGLQEIRLAYGGHLIDSRLASTIDTPTEARYRSQSQWDMSTRSTATPPFVVHPQLMNPPTSISYQHPYLLVSLPDNTLMSYAVTSNTEKLEISTGRRLWGHTSGVTGAEVSNRGKAVSVSSKGNEIRIWELEDLLMTFNQRGNSTRIKSGQDVAGLTNAISKRGSGLGLALQEIKKEHAFTRQWVGFDDEQVVVLGECEAKQIMSCYDFS